MEGFDPGTMTYLDYTHVSSMPLAALATSSDYSKMMLPMDMHDHVSNYDANTYAGCASFHLVP